VVSETHKQGRGGHLPVEGGKSGPQGEEKRKHTKVQTKSKRGRVSPQGHVFFLIHLQMCLIGRKGSVWTEGRGVEASVITKKGGKDLVRAVDINKTRELNSCLDMNGGGGGGRNERGGGGG